MKPFKQALLDAVLQTDEQNKILRHRISTLETLLRDIERNVDDGNGDCLICLSSLKDHDKLCHITRIQKELGEG